MSGKRPSWDLWLRWVLANCVGEAVGLGATALAGVGLVTTLGAQRGVVANLLLAGSAILAGTFLEGTVVGTAQWLVLRRPLPETRWRAWVLATAAGAFLAWTLGMIPSTLINVRTDAGTQTPVDEPSAAVIYGLAFLMGLLLGPVLGFAQWLVLRRHVRRASLWMPANALAWALGMVVVFVGVTSVPAGGNRPWNRRAHNPYPRRDRGRRGYGPRCGAHLATAVAVARTTTPQRYPLTNEDHLVTAVRKHCFSPSLCSPAGSRASSTQPSARLRPESCPRAGRRAPRWPLRAGRVRPLCGRAPGEPGPGTPRRPGA